MSVSADPLGAIISQWLVKTLEAMSQGRTSEEEEEQKQWGGGGISQIMNDSDILVMRRVKAGISGDSSAFSVTKKKRRGADNWGVMEHFERCRIQVPTMPFGASSLFKESLYTPATSRD